MQLAVYGRRISVSFLLVSVKVLSLTIAIIRRVVFLLQLFARFQLSSAAKRPPRELHAMVWGLL
jgi:hypothetical protein